MHLLCLNKSQQICVRTKSPQMLVIVMAMHDFFVDVSGSGRDLAPQDNVVCAVFRHHCNFMQVNSVFNVLGQSFVWMVL